MEKLELDIYKRYQSFAPVNERKFFPVGKTISVHLNDILELYDAFCFDGYGTLYNRGSYVYPGALEWIKSLRMAKKQVSLITNAASNVDEVLAKEANERGFDFSAMETISSGSLLKNWISLPEDFGLDMVAAQGIQTANALRHSSNREVFYIGRPTGVNVLEGCGIKSVANPNLPIVAISSSTATAEMYEQALRILRKPGALLLVLNPDAWAPNVDGSRIPVSGALCEKLRRGSSCAENGYSGCAVQYFGKPFPSIWEKVRTSLPANARVLMIGDTLGTDVFGAQVAGIDSALVVGRNEPATELKSDEDFLNIRPTYYLVP